MIHKTRSQRAITFEGYKMLEAVKVHGKTGKTYKRYFAVCQLCGIVASKALSTKLATLRATPRHLDHLT